MTGIVPTVFRFPGTLAHGASPGTVVGSFNGWDPAGHRLARTPDGDWTITMYLVPGRAVYHFDVDGAYWLDPFDHGRLRNGWGPSIRLVTSAGRQRPVGPDPRPGRGGYAGLAVSVRQSGGTERYGKITKQGRKRLRTIAIRAVLAMVTGRRTLMDFYVRKKQEKGAGKALCAAARKLLTIVFVMLKKDLDYWYLEDRLYQRKLQSLPGNRVSP